VTLIESVPLALIRIEQTLVAGIQLNRLAEAVMEGIPALEIIFLTANTDPLCHLGIMRRQALMSEPERLQIPVIEGIGAAGPGLGQAARGERQ